MKCQLSFFSKKILSSGKKKKHCHLMQHSLDLRIKMLFIFISFQKLGLDISCELSPKVLIVTLNVKIYFVGKVTTVFTLCIRTDWPNETV